MQMRLLRWWVQSDEQFRVDAWPAEVKKVVSRALVP